MDGAMGQILPLTIAAGVHPLEPYREFTLFRIPTPVPCSIASIRDRDIAVKLNLYRVQLAHCVWGLANSC